MHLKIQQITRKDLKKIAEASAVANQEGAKNGFYNI
jgi:hypothetical protein